MPKPPAVTKARSTSTGLRSSKGRLVLIPTPGGHAFPVVVNPREQEHLRFEMQASARREKRKAASADNAGETAKIISGVGGALATAGTIALAIGTLPAALPGLAVTGFAYAVAIGGLWVRHRVVERGIWHREQQEAFADLAAELER